MRIINSLLNFLQHIENITLNISIDTFVMEKTIICFMYQFIFLRAFHFAFQFKFPCLFEGGFYHFPSQTPLPSPTLYGYLDSGTSDLHRGGHATASYAFLSMGN